MVYECAICEKSLRGFMSYDGFVCSDCVPYTLESSWRINQVPSRYGGLILTGDCTQEVISESQRNGLTIIIAKNSVIKDKKFSSGTVYNNLVTYEDCSFDRVLLNYTMRVDSDLLFTGCKGDVDISSGHKATIIASNMSIDGSIKHLKVFSSSIELKRVRIVDVETENSKITAYQRINIIKNVNSTIEQPEARECYVCKKMIDGQYTTMLNKKQVHSDCVLVHNSDKGNTLVVGDKKDAYGKFCIELEINSDYSSNYEQLLLDLIMAKCLRKCDGTVTDEFNTPIFKNEKEFLQFEPLFRSAVPYVNHAARTHIHVGVPQRLKEFCYANYHIFQDLTSYLEEFEYDTKRFFGCGFSGLCPAEVSNGGRFYWVNVCSHYQTIEFRLAQLTSWEQYLRVVRFYRELIKFIHQNVIKLPEYKTGGRVLNTTRQELNNKVLSFYHDYRHNN